MENECIIGRHIDGITLNDYEYVLEYTGEIKIFENKDCAVGFLKQQGFSEENIKSLQFFNYQKFQENIYEEIA